MIDEGREGRGREAGTEEGREGKGGEAGTEMGIEKGVIRTYEDLDVYRRSYEVMLVVFRRILSMLPTKEKYDLADQLSRSSKAIPRLIAEGHSKRHQVRGFQKYIDDAHAESNEMIVSLNQVKDLYASREQAELIKNAIHSYDVISRQLYNLSKAWINYSKDRK